MGYFFRLFFRNLRRNKTFSIIAISSFTLSLTIVLLLSSFLFYEISYDKFYSNLNQIYCLINQDNNSSLNEDIIDPLKNEYPEIKTACRYNIYNGTVVYNEQPFEFKNVLHTESSFFEIFNTDFIYGNPQTAMDTKENVILSGKAAQKIFGDENPIGKIISLNHAFSMVVSGVIKEFPDNSSFQPDIIIHRDLRTNYEGANLNGIEVYYNRFFILLNPGSNPADLSSNLSTNLLKQNLIDRPVKLLPFRKSHMNSITVRSHLKHANLLLIYILSGITLIILFISALNLVILFTAHHLNRLKEIGLKRAIGMSRRQIFIQFLCEAILICFLSFFMAMIIAELLHPYFENIVDKKFPLFASLQFPNIIYLITGIFIVAVLSGWYPALLVSRFQPHPMFQLKGSSNVSFKIKAGLLIVQYFVTIVLIVSLIVITKQIDFIKHKDLGFDSEQLILLKVHWKISQKLPFLKQELVKHPLISYAASSNGGPGEIHCSCSWREAQEKGVWNTSVPYIPVDYDFFNVFNTSIIKGRNFHQFEENTVIMNETAWNTIGWKSLDGKKFRNKEIVGVVKDVHVSNMHKEIAPTFFMLDDRSHTWLTLRVQPGDIQGVIHHIQKVWKEISPDFVLDLSFYDEWINSQYRTEENLNKAIRLSVIIAIIIACLGSFTVVQFITSKRIKEIGIRKIHGAGTIQIVTLLNINFIKWISYAFLLAIPFSWTIMKIWLQNFAYKTVLSWWIFVLSGFIVVIIALVTISFLTIRTAMENPVKSLRYE